MLLSINENRNEKHNYNHRAGDYGNYDYTSREKSKSTSRPNSIDFVIPNALISLWIIPFVNGEVITYVTARGHSYS